MAATSSAVKYSRPLTLAGRSNGVIVRLENVPCRSGSPHGVFGVVYGFAGGAPGLPFWAITTAVGRRTLTTATMRTKFVSRMLGLQPVGPAEAGHYILEIHLRSELREPRRENTRRRQPCAAGNERLVIRLDRVGV